jgi:hypothetical protein
MLKTNDSLRNSLVLPPKNQYQEIIRKKQSLSLQPNNKAETSKNISLRLSSFHSSNN